MSIHGQDSIGELGELLAAVFLSRKTSRGFLFRTLVIGGKWPTIDLYAELLPDNTGRVQSMDRMFCFIQVKTTKLGYLKNGNLRVNVKKVDLNRLANYCGPTYLVGIDLDEHDPRNSTGYIAFSRPNQPQSLSSLPTANDLNAATLVQLYDEVADFWNQTNTLALKTSFASAF